MALLCDLWEVNLPLCPWLALSASEAKGLPFLTDGSKAQLISISDAL